MQIWYELGRAGEAGLTLDELVERVGPHVPRGYAWRRYVASIESRQRNRLRERGLVRSPLPRSELVPDTPGNRALAIRSLVRTTAQDMMANKKSPSAIRRPDGRYVVGPRKPRSVFSDEFHDFDGSVSRKAVTDMELVRFLRTLLAQINEGRAHGAKHNPAISLSFETVLRRWFDAHAASSLPTEPSWVSKEPEPQTKTEMEQSNAAAEYSNGISAELRRYPRTRYSTFVTIEDVAKFVRLRSACTRSKLMGSLNVSPATIDALLAEYAARYPGCVVHDVSANNKPRTMVYPPTE